MLTHKFNVKFLDRFHLSVALIAVLSVITSITACSGTEAVSETQTEPQRDITEMEAIYWERIQESRMNFTRADIDFMYGMIPHHTQALIMSRLAPENNASRSVQTLAARIINAQGDEIALMNQWLEDRGQPVPEIHIDGLEMMVHLDMEMDDHNGHSHDSHGHHSMHDHSDMPGMLSQQQLQELAAAEGTEFDRKFLEFMIEHHKGAIIMVDELFAADGAASDREMFDLASGINAEQVTEIERMRQMLEAIE